MSGVKRRKRETPQEMARQIRDALDAAIATLPNENKP